MREEAGTRRNSSPARTLGKILFLPVVAVVAVAPLLAQFALGFVPLPRGLFEMQVPSAEFTDRHGRPLREMLVDRRYFARPARLDDVPRVLINATVAAEDKRFWQHGGVNVPATARAALSFAKRGRVVSGASTTTQQLVKISTPARGPNPRTVRIKIMEIVQALRLEKAWTKQRIIETYLNRLDYGNLRIGCAAAAEFYFGKPPADLSAAEAAFLAGLPQSPVRLNPHLHFARAKKRQAWVLGQMQRNGLLAEADYRRALAEPLRLQPPRQLFRAAHLVDLVLSQRRDEILAAVVPANSGKSVRSTADVSPKEIRTTVDLELTQFVERTLRARMGGLREGRTRHGNRNGRAVGNGAVVVLDNRTGDVLALVGSEDYFAPGHGQVNGAWARRSAGSTFKPFTYLLAFERGATPATVVADLPAEFPTTTGVYRPENYNRRSYGPMRYRLALANSLNISAVKVLASIGGAETLQRRLRECGLTTLEQSADRYGLGLTIGNADARLLELTNAYACLARFGKWKPYRLLTGEPQRDGVRICDAGAAYLVADILRDNDARTLAFGARSALRFDFPVACKTGTSSDFRDNWAIGFTPEFTVGVWVGNFDGSPMEGVSGVTGAAPVLHDVFTFLHDRDGTTWYSQPANVVELPVHALTGRRLAADTPTAGGTENSVRERFLRENLPLAASPDDCDELGRVRLGSEYRDWLGCGENWLAGRAVASGDEAPEEVLPGGHRRESARPTRIVSPVPGTTFLLDPDLPAQRQWVPLVADDGGRSLEWRSESLRVVRRAGKIYAVPAEGKHGLTAVDTTSGCRSETWIVVKAL